ncbi:hypothetical protein HGRIS_008500 [Hohenbuehelia grisea]|uniref:TPR-like protein n=1 Tax=Hohenbuehelia grisea TaxID=104357 RepID=A0ABR3J869_9AGAR
MSDSDSDHEDFVAGEYNPELAGKLKDEGNALHGKGKYRDAYKKYTEAISHDPKNAILWANRAATSIAMKEYFDACYDSRKAIKCDPNYTKAYARLGAAAKATNSFIISIEAWKEGLATLPPAGQLDEGQKRLRDQLKAGLIETERTQKARASIPNDRIHSFPVGPETDTKLPWLRAEEMLEELFETKNSTSSAWVIMTPLPAWKAGLAKLEKVEEHRENGQVTYSGEVSALQDFVNALCRDIRIFHCTPDFFGKITKQFGLEYQAYGAWSGGAKTVQEAALVRLKASGWKATGPALEITVRAWVLQAFLANSSGERKGAHQLYRQALDVIEWGAKEFKDVAKEDRCYVFDPVFARNVRQLWMGTVMELCKIGGHDYTYDDLEKIARGIIEDVDENPQHELLSAQGHHDYGAYLAWWTYPKAEAYSVIGWCHLQRAGKARNEDRKEEYYDKAFEAYMKSADLFPEDDEHHVYFLEVALNTRWLTKAPLKETLPICKRIRIAMPKMMRIWEFSAMSKRRDPPLQVALEYEADAQKVLYNALAALEQSFDPASIKDFLAQFERPPMSSKSSKSKKKKGRN